MFKIRRNRILFSVIAGAIIAEFLRILTGGVEINFLFFVIPINYLIIGIMYVQKWNEYAKNEKSNDDSDELLDNDLS